MRIHVSVSGGFWKMFTHFGVAVNRRDFTALAGIFNATDNLKNQLCVDPNKEIMAQ